MGDNLVPKGHWFVISTELCGLAALDFMWNDGSPGLLIRQNHGGASGEKTTKALAFTPTWH
jgi:hypothetical protein